MLLEIGSFDAKTRLSELLRNVETGERYRITVRGRPVADLVPCSSNAQGSAEDAVAQMHSLERISSVSHDNIKDWVAQGRK